MKIICIGRNYIDHAKELNNPVPASPVFFLKPDSAILRNNSPFFYPDFSEEIHYETELVYRIGKLGKTIQEKFAHTYYDAIGLGIDFTARDLQNQCKEKGLPWEVAKAFDGSAVVSKLMALSELGNMERGTKNGEQGGIGFQLRINRDVVQTGNSKNMIFSIDRIIAHVSRYMTLKTGDLIFTGTPAGVGPVQIGHHLEGWLEDKKLLDFFIR
ncbi:MAG: fumarylacetoacetate hydrolase family protein [Bacteroidetes bacterium]|nr:fumarylacetoacetate hydrolase family protein [Bacteroidota bacterium]